MRMEPLIGNQQAGDQVQERRLAAAALANQRDLLSRCDFQIRDIKNGQASPFWLRVALDHVR